MHIRNLSSLRRLRFRLLVNHHTQRYMLHYGRINPLNTTSANTAHTSLRIFESVAFMADPPPQSVNRTQVTIVIPSKRYLAGKTCVSAELNLMEQVVC